MRRAAVATVALAMVLSACTQSSDEPASPTSVATSPATTPAATSTVATSTTSTSTTTSAPQPSTTDAPTTTVPSETVALVVGDFGTGTESQAAVSAAMERVAIERNATALITTGDNFYTDDGDAIWTEPYGWVDAHGLEVYAAWGNHDIESQDRIELVDELLAPPGRWYNTRLGAANLIVLDANRPLDGGQKAFLRKLLERFARQPVIIAFHQPAHSCSRHGSTSDIIESWQFLIEKSGVDVVLTGHDHNYQRIFQGNVTYIVTGGGGRELYEIGSCPPGTTEPLVANDTDHHFLVLTIKTGTIEVEAVAADGATIDEFAIVNKPPRSARPIGVQ